MKSSRLLSILLLLQTRGRMTAAELAAELENVAVVVEEESPDDPGLLGLWESHPYLPDKITIFRRVDMNTFGIDQIAQQRSALTFV